MTTILFLLSLFVVCGMIASKVFEVKFNRAHFLSELFTKGDQKIHKILDRGILRYYRYKKIGNLFVFEFLPAYAYEVLVKTRDITAHHYNKMTESFQGRRILKSSGSVSFFLERLADDKKVEKKS